MGYWTTNHTSICWITTFFSLQNITKSTTFWSYFRHCLFHIFSIWNTKIEIYSMSSISANDVTYVICYIWTYPTAQCLVWKSVQDIHDHLSLTDRLLVSVWQKQKLPQSLQYISCLPQKWSLDKTRQNSDWNIGMCFSWSMFFQTGPRTFPPQSVSQSADARQQESGQGFHPV